MKLRALLSANSAFNSTKLMINFVDKNNQPIAKVIPEIAKKVFGRFDVIGFNEYELKIRLALYRDTKTGKYKVYRGDLK